MGSGREVDASLEDLPPLKSVSLLLICLTAAGVQSGFLFGYDTGIVSGAMVLIRDEFQLDDLWQELIISVTLGAAAVSAFLGGFLNSWFGRKRVVLGCSGLFIVGALVLACSPNRAVLLVGRIILGLAIGASSSTIPAYVAECSPAHVRGRMLVTFQLAMTGGFFIAALIAASLTYLKDTDLSWRLMLGLGGVPALAQLIVFSFMPESPRWLALHGRGQGAYDAMVRIYGGGELAAKHAELELKAIMDSEEECEREKERLGVADQPTLLAILRTPHLRKALVIGCSLQMLQQLSGVNTVNYYGATIIIMSGIQSHTAIWLTSVTSGVKFLSTFIGMYGVEKIGRRLLLLCSTLGVFLTLTLLGISFTVIAQQSPRSSFHENGTDVFNDTVCSRLGCDGCSYNAKCGFCFYDSNVTKSGSCVRIGEKNQWASYGRCARNPMSTDGDSNLLADPTATWDYGFCPTSMSWLPVLGLVLYLLSFGSGYAPMPWTINAEIFPNWARSAGNAMSTGVNYAFNLLISLTFLTLARAITRQGAFFLYAGFTLVALVWFYLVVPETKDKGIEEVQDVLKGPWFSRGREPARDPATPEDKRNHGQKSGGAIR